MLNKHSLYTFKVVSLETDGALIVTVPAFTESGARAIVMREFLEAQDTLNKNLVSMTLVDEQEVDGPMHRVILAITPENLTYVKNF
jgi:hypothetical protein